MTPARRTLRSFLLLTPAALVMTLCGVVIMKAPQKGGSIYGGLWLWIWPNMTLSVYPDGMNTSRIVPTSETRTELRYEFYFADRSPALMEKHKATIATNCEIVREDFGICEEVQQNLKAGIYRDGPLSPRHEDGVQYFQDMVRQSLAAMPADGSVGS